MNLEGNKPERDVLKQLRAIMSDYLLYTDLKTNFRSSQKRIREHKGTVGNCSVSKNSSKGLFGRFTLAHLESCMVPFFMTYGVIYIAHEAYSTMQSTLACVHFNSMSRWNFGHDMTFARAPIIQPPMISPPLSSLGWYNVVLKYLQRNVLPVHKSVSKTDTKLLCCGRGQH
jgi:hypothetical protein